MFFLTLKYQYIGSSDPLSFTHGKAIWLQLRGCHVCCCSQDLHFYYPRRRFVFTAGNNIEQRRDRTPAEVSSAPFLSPASPTRW